MQKSDLQHASEIRFLFEVDVFGIFLYGTDLILYFRYYSLKLLSEISPFRRKSIFHFSLFHT